MSELFKHTGVYDKYGIELYPGDIIGAHQSTKSIIEAFGSHLAGSFSYRPLGATNPTSSYPLYDLMKYDGLEIIGHEKLGEIDIHAIAHVDLQSVQTMDEKSGFKVYDMLSDRTPDEYGDYAYGAFLNDKLIGYCTVGGADALYDNFKDYRHGDLCLSDVYVMEEYRHKHVGSIMVAKAIVLAFNNVRHNVFATVLNDDEIPFYKNLGFSVIDKNAGIICKRVNYDNMTVEEYNTCFLPAIDSAKSFVSLFNTCLQHMELDEAARIEVNRLVCLYGWSPSVEDVLLKALECYRQHEGINKLP